MKRIKEPTSTKIVFEALIAADDFLTGKQLQVLTGLSSNRVSAALYSLLNYKAVEFIESERKLWWFATLASDTRSRTVDQRAPELRQRKSRKPRKLKETK